MKTHSYQSLLENADQQFEHTQQRHSSSFSCRNGCHSCCEPDLSVLPVEANNIRQYLETHPEIYERIQKIHLADPHNGTRCSFLSEKGHCSIYPVRPFICRSHGAPIAIAREEYYQIDVCPLNFNDNPIEELGPEDFFILDDWNDRLCSVDEDESRIPLNVLALFK